ncbi:FAD-dependent oxidoreductase domain-containing protein 1 [Bienertia sinuspersici]
MPEELSKKLKNFLIQRKRTRWLISLMLMGKMLKTRPFNVEAMKRNLRAVWRLKEGVAVRMVETNLFVCHGFSTTSRPSKEDRWEHIIIRGKI